MLLKGVRHLATLESPARLACSVDEPTPRNGARPDVLAERKLMPHKGAAGDGLGRAHQLRKCRLYLRSRGSTDCALHCFPTQMQRYRSSQLSCGKAAQAHAI